MKLSDAIRLNGVFLPQGFGGLSLLDPTAPCAIGGALISAGVDLNDFFGNQVSAFGKFQQLWPWTEEMRSTCPAQHNAHLCPITDLRVVDIIWRLNDEHKWTRQQIADWVATVEPQEHPEVDVTSPATEELCLTK